jgi:hypothetical protein
MTLIIKEARNHENRVTEGRISALFRSLIGVRVWAGRRLISLGQILINQCEKDTAFDRKFAKP